ncbi:MAG TPA: ABC transporter permease [Blastocatellia bacterium]|nr:ABC transporter permease [Blastocatellia bacterium]
METLWQDLRYGFRVLIRKPGFTLVAIITLALGIGANTAIFSVVNKLLLDRLPYKDPDRIITLWERLSEAAAMQEKVAPANFLDWRERNQVFDQMAAVFPYGFDYTGGAEPESIRGWLVSEGFFEIFGVRALYGRTFDPEEFKPGGSRVVVIGYGLWQRRFGSDPQIVGQTLQLDNEPYTVVGVLPPEFRFLDEKQMWAPKVFSDLDRRLRTGGYINVVARLKPGVSVEQAEDDMARIAAGLASEHPRTNQGTGVMLVPLPEQLVEHVRPALLVLLGAVGLVLIIACANVANLLLARGAERQKELAIRAALGAGRARLIRQLFTESLFLALLGGVCGILLASWGIDAILALSPAGLPRIDEVSIDARVIAFTFAVSIVTALTFGLAPAIQFSSPKLQQFLKEGGRTSTAGFGRRRLRHALVVSEIALALMLLVGAGLLVRSFIRLLQVDPGFTPDNVLSLQVFIWDKYQTPQQRTAFFDEAFSRLSSLPGVQAVGAVTALPFNNEDTIDVDTTFTIDGKPAEPGQQLTAYSTVASIDYFKVMGIHLKSGRFFNEYDRPGSPLVVLINEAMARRFWPDEDPVGKRITVGSFGRPMSREIIGVVADVRHIGLDSDPRPEFFVPHLQNPFGGMAIVVRTSSDPETLLPAAKDQIRAINKDQPFYSINTMEALVSRSLGERRFNLLLICAFATIALVLAGVGIYGLISFSISQRTHEIGVRMALGARARDITGMILGEGIALALAGIAAGVVGALVLTRLLKGFLFGVTPTDPVTFAVISALLVALALVASYVPARRATRVDPMVALRYE